MMSLLTSAAEAQTFSNRDRDYYVKHREDLDVNRLIGSLFISCFVISFIVGCASAPKQPEMTPLEIQSMQTRQYEDEKNIVFRSVISVFQDLGYTIKQADTGAGFIQADGSADSNESLKFWIGSTKTTQTKVSAFVERIGQKTQVRISFVETVESSTMYGADDREETQILIADIYQNAFERIDNAIFVRKSTT
jgi:hypothetical protein